MKDTVFPPFRKGGERVGHAVSFTQNKIPTQAKEAWVGYQYAPLGGLRQLGRLEKLLRFVNQHEDNFLCTVRVGADPFRKLLHLGSLAFDVAHRACGILDFGENRPEATNVKRTVRRFKRKQHSRKPICDMHVLSRCYKLVAVYLEVPNMLGAASLIHWRRRSRDRLLARSFPDQGQP